MSRGLIVLVLLSFSEIAFGQLSKSVYIKFDNGLLISSFQSKPNFNLLSEDKKYFTTSLGIDYFHKKRVYLSSQLGYLKIGGVDGENGLSANSDYNTIESSEYVHFNSTLRILTKDQTLFIGIGPYCNFLVSSKNFKGDFYKDYYQYNTVNIGGKGELGIKRDINKIRISIIGSYMFNLSPVAKTDYILFNSQIYSAMLSLGYKLK